MTVDEINALIGVDDVMFAPTTLMTILLDPIRREDLFRRFLARDTHLEHDWFQEYFEQEQAQRKTQKQDFTPECVSETMNRLLGPGGTMLDVAAGTGGILINRWWRDCVAHTPFFSYRPSLYWYEAEELSERAVPFLLFNMAIRGMNGAVTHGDSLQRRIRHVYLIQNYDDDMLHFSDINIMPRTPVVTRHFNVHEWVGDHIDHIERINDDLADLAQGLCR